MQKYQQDWGHAYHKSKKKITNSNIKLEIEFFRQGSPEHKIPPSYIKNSKTDGPQLTRYALPDLSVFPVQFSCPEECFLLL